MSDRLAALGFADSAFAAELLVSELVTNAVLHARTDIRVSVDQHGDVVRIGVADFSPRQVRMVRRSAESGTGRGLLLVDGIATRWGIEPLERGKVVWFELPRQPVIDLLDDAALDAWEV